MLIFLVKMPKVVSFLSKNLKMYWNIFQKRAKIVIFLFKKMKRIPWKITDGIPYGNGNTEFRNSVAHAM